MQHLAGGLFNVLHGWISHEAMKKVKGQLKLLDKKDPLASSVYTGAFTRSYGLPCAHRIRRCKTETKVFE
jgi:hypothetical protein